MATKPSFNLSRMCFNGYSNIFDIQFSDKNTDIKVPVEYKLDESELKVIQKIILSAEGQAEKKLCPQ